MGVLVQDGGTKTNGCHLRPMLRVTSQPFARRRVDRPLQSRTTARRHVITKRGVCRYDSAPDYELFTPRVCGWVSMQRTTVSSSRLKLGLRPYSGEAERRYHRRRRRIVLKYIWGQTLVTWLQSTRCSPFIHCITVGSTVDRHLQPAGVGG